jgi:type 2 lantibiotic biosynthesis protein LanM
VPVAILAASLTTDWWLGARSRAESGTGPAGGRPPADVPRWAVFVEQVLAGAPEVASAFGRCAPPVDDGPASLGPALAPFAAAAWCEGPASVAEPPSCPVDVPALRAEFEADLQRRLAGLAARTLLVELHGERTSGRLAGDTGRDRFTHFLRSTATRQGLTRLVARYPVLARLLATACLHAADAHVELRTRWAADRADVVADLAGGVDPGRLVSLGPAAGDLHRRGRAVRVLTFATGARIVHRPRPPAAHVHFGELVDWLEGVTGGLGLRTPRAVDRGTHGWVEFVEAEPCRTELDVYRFHSRLGALCALVHAVGGTDMHLENLIAAGDTPVLIDVETLFHPGSTPLPMTGVDPAAEALSTSVLRTALLPQPWLGEHGALDVSGLGGNEGSIFPFDVVRFAGSGTDAMRLVRGPAPFTGRANRPRLDGRACDPAEYEGALLTGFRRAYDAVAAHRDELLGPGGLLQLFAHDECRVVLRPTELYVRLLDESTHPDLLRSGPERDRFLDLLLDESAGQPALTALVPGERADLWNADVPIFTARPSGRTVCTSSGEELVDLLDRPGTEAAAARLAALSTLDRDAQEWFISASLACRRPAVQHLPGPPAGPTGVRRRPFLVEPEQLLTAARGLGDELLSRSLVAGGRVNWNGVEPLDDRFWSVSPLGAGLGYGYTGTALFLAELGVLTGVYRYREVARAAVAALPLLLSALAADDGLLASVGGGAFSGLGGITYGVLRLSELLDDDALRSWLPAAVQLTARAAALPPGPDGCGVADGTAGAVAALAAVDRAIGSPRARRAVEELLPLVAATGPLPRGFAAGADGVDWALRCGGGLPAAVPGADRTPRTEPVDDASWCRGAAGVVLARLTATGAAAGIDDAHVLGLLGAAPVRDLSPCHGEVGVLEALAGLGAAGHAEAADACARRTAALLETLRASGPRCGTPRGVLTPGLLNGLAGIGLGLLRIGFADRVPSALLLGTTSSSSRGMTPPLLRGELP